MKALLKIKSFGSIILIILTLSLKASAQDVKVDLNTKEKLGLGMQYYNQGNFSASKEEFTLYLKSKEKVPAQRKGGLAESTELTGILKNAGLKG